jgi:dipeptidyl aminopeptidase/acylaminoacyl peptidase
MLDLAQLLRVPHVDHLFDLSPDGSKLAFAWNRTGDWQIYELFLAERSVLRLRAEQKPLNPPLRTETPTTKSEVEARVDVQIKQITSGPGGKFNPRYSPDGSRLAYVLDMDGSESYHLVVYDFSANTHTDLTPDISHALQPNFCWSPDGHQLAFLSDEHGHFSAYVIPVSGGKPQLVLDTGHPAWQVEWSPDGRHLAVSCEMRGQDYGIFIVNLENKEVTMLCHPERQRHLHRTQVQVRVSDNNEEILRPYGAQNDMINAHEPRWSPDVSKLAFHSDKHGWFDIGMYDLSTREIEWLTQNEGDSQTPVFISNSLSNTSEHQIAYTQSRNAVNWIELFGNLGGESVGQAFSLTPPGISEVGGLQTRPTSRDVGKKYQVGRGIHGGIRLTSDMKRIVTTFSGPGQPPDLWMIDLESGKSIQLTNSLPEELLKAEFVLPEEIRYEGMDGVEVPALLFRPKQVPAPAVVMIHGGPNWHYSAEWNPVMAHLASRGYVVLAPNYRGSTGYGREWQYAAQFNMGGVDTRDVAAGAQFLLHERLASKVAVTGRSHGGYLTMTCLTQFPELWCAGSAVVPFTNWFKSHDDSREDLQHWNIENMGDPQENYERWYNASPYFFLDRIQSPVQMICGGNDPRCPASDSIDTRDKLIEMGKSVELLLYEDEGHAFLKIENVLDAEMKRMEFLMKALE